MLISLAGHCNFLLEQPTGSADVIPHHPRLSWLTNRVAVAAHLKVYKGFVKQFYMRSLQKVFNILGLTIPLAEVWRHNFWMIHHGSKSTKRTTVWSVRKVLVHGLVHILGLIFGLDC